MACWKEQLVNSMKHYGETFADVVFNTMTEGEMAVEFDDGYGTSEGIPFAVWTKKRVYFPAVYDGCEWVVSVSRDPDGEPIHHVGGE